MSRLKDLRLEANLTQEDLATRLFITQQAVHNYESGKNIPDISILKKMSVLYNVSIDYLVELTDIKTPASKMKQCELNDLEVFLLDFYRNLPIELQSTVVKLLDDVQKAYRK